MKEFIFMNGEPFKAMFPLRSIYYGEGVFETFRWKAVPPVFWDKHLLRMKKGAEVLGIPFPGVADIELIIEQAILDSHISDAYVKICLLSRGGSSFYENSSGHSLLSIVREFRHPKEPLKACVSSFRRNSMSPILGIKSLNYLENILARREAIALGFDESIFLNEEGKVTEASASNIFWLKNGALFTPSLDCGLLPGVIRGVVIEIAEDLGIQVIEGQFDLSVLIPCQGLFFTNSLTGIASTCKVNEFNISFDSTEVMRLKSAIIERLKWV